MDQDEIIREEWPRVSHPNSGVLDLSQEAEIKVRVGKGSKAE